MSDLREQLARRLASLQWEGLATQDYPGELIAPMEIVAGQGPGTTWGDLADEVIRQMEWAHEVGFDSCCNRSKDKAILLVPDGTKLTLAPKDWTP